jgi:aryl-alcohol dehydrogenase-like predicted oxidoreductase
MSLQDEGKIRMIGISNAYDVRLLEALAKERKIDVVQNLWYQANSWDKDVYQYCMDNGIQYQLRFFYSLMRLTDFRGQVVLDPVWLAWASFQPQPTCH